MRDYYRDYERKKVVRSSGERSLIILIITRRVCDNYRDQEREKVAHSSGQDILLSLLLLGSCS